MGFLSRDLAFAVRRVRRYPGPSIGVGLTLSLGIAAATAVFGAVHAILLRPLPFRDPNALVSVNQGNPPDPAAPFISSVGEFHDVQRAHSFVGVATEASVSLNVTGLQSQPERITSIKVSDTWFEVLGISPTTGRAFTADEQIPGMNRVAILTYGLWQRTFGGDPKVVGRTIDLDGLPYQIIGVMPASFQDFFRPRAEIIVPLALTLAQINGPYARANLNLTARLRTGVTAQSAEKEVQGIVDQWKQAHAGEVGPKFTLGVRSLNEIATRQIRPVLAMLMGATVLLLLVVCTNIAGLLLARSLSRSKEIAVRMAIGANRPMLLYQFGLEGIILAALGAVPGVLLARIALWWLVSMHPNVPRINELAIGPAEVLVALIVAVALGILFGMAPALTASGAELAASMNESTRSASLGRRAGRFMSALAVAEVAVALALLIATGLLIRSTARVQGVDPGFDMRHTLMFRVSLPSAAYGSDSAVRLFIDQVREHIGAAPGVESVGAISNVPFDGTFFTASLGIEGQVRAKDESPPEGDIRFASNGYFEAMGVRLLRGRTFDQNDVARRPLVAIIDEQFAKRWFGGLDPIGRRIALDADDNAAHPTWATIVGLATHVAQESLDGQARIQFYFPFAQKPADIAIRSFGVVVRSKGDPSRVLPGVSDAVREVDPRVPLAAVSTMDVLVERTLASRRVSTALLGAFSLFAIVLASIGVYGMLSFLVQQRSKELAIRFALGGSRLSVIALVFRRGLSLIGVGVAAGLVTALGLTRFLSSQLFGVTATDPGSFALATVVLLAVAVTAIMVPTRRAARVDPMSTLRQE